MFDLLIVLTGIYIFNMFLWFELLKQVVQVTSFKLFFLFLALDNQEGKEFSSNYNLQKNYS